MADRPFASWPHEVHEFSYSCVFAGCHGHDSGNRRESSNCRPDDPRAIALTDAAEALGKR